MIDIVGKAKAYAIRCHAECNHLYDGKPYQVHLELVQMFIERFIHLIPEKYRDYVRGGGWTHDLVEDSRQTFNDVKNATCIEIAEYAYALTNEKGKTRGDRANEKYYKDIRALRFATYLKICDRLANVYYSKNKGSRMIEVYKKEKVHFKKELTQKTFWEKTQMLYKRIFKPKEYFVEDYSEMFSFMDSMFEVDFIYNAL